MLGVPRCVDGQKAQAADDDLLRIIRDFELILSYRQKLTPKRIHPISVNTGGAGDQFFRVQHMRRTDGMHINLRALT